MLPTRLLKPVLLGDAEPTSMVLPTSRWGAIFLIGRVGDKVHAVFLSGEHKFRAFAAEGNTSWRGLQIKDISILADPLSAIEEDQAGHVTGSLVSTPEGVCLYAISDRNYGSLLPILLNEHDQPITEDAPKIIYPRWQIVAVAEAGSEVVLYQSWDADGG